MIGTLWVLAVVLPLAGATLAGVTSRSDGPARRVAGWVVRWAPLLLLPTAVLVLLGPSGSFGVPWLMDGVVVGLDVVSRALTMVAVLLYGAATHAVTWARDPRAPQLVAYLLVCFVGNVGVYVAQDVVTFYVAFAWMSFAAVGLVIHERTATARRANRVYLVLAVVSEAALLVGLVLVAQAGGTALADAPAAVVESPYTAVIVVLLLIGFGIKAGIFGLHVWLPLAHPAAPPPASAVLSGAMVKAGVVGWLRFLPLTELAMPEMGYALVAISLLGAFLAVPAGAVQKDPKVVLAYSTISQMGFLGAAIGVALASPDLAPAAMTASVAYAVHHGLAKGALFLGVPVTKHHGRGRTRWLVVAGLVVASLAVAGAPFSSGSIGKYAVKEAVYGIEVLGVDLVTLLPLVATGSTLLLLRFGWLLMRAEPEPLDPTQDPELPSWLVLVVTSATVPFILTNRWVPLADVPELEATTLWDATWPVLLGPGIGAAFLRWPLGLRARRAVERTLPPGDLLVPVEHAVAASGGAVQRVATALAGWQTTVAGRARAVGGSVGRGGGRVAGVVESALVRWRGSGVAILAVLVVLLGLAMGAP